MNKISKDKLLCYKHGFRRYYTINDKKICDICYRKIQANERRELTNSIFVICEKHGEQHITNLKTLKCRKCSREERKPTVKKIQIVYCPIHGRVKYNKQYYNGCERCNQLMKK